MLNKINYIEIGGKPPEQEKVITNLENFYKSKEEVFNFYRDYPKLFFDASNEAK